jgi:serine/threonine-protein kinase
LSRTLQREAAILETLGRAIPKSQTYLPIFKKIINIILVQEWIDGKTLSEQLTTEGLYNEATAVMLLQDLLPVLNFMHGQGMVHRDIKPENIIVRRADGKPVLIDFGAVRETMGTVVNSQGQTTSSIVIGTPGFMSSEQSSGRPVFSSDLYSLGFNPDVFNHRQDAPGFA